MLNDAAVLTMFQNYQTVDRRLSELIAAVVRPGSLPAEVQVTAMPGESIHDIYSARKLSAAEAGIEVVGIDSFLEGMSGHRDEEVGLFRISNERGWVFGAFDQRAHQLLACVGKFSHEGSTTTP